jgi:phosphatidylinositol alpha-1,6-mannosyltransferase
VRTLLITNDFPPRLGGIQVFVHDLATRLPGGELVVYCSDWRGSAEFDAQQPFPVIRENTKVLLPTRRVAQRAAALAAEHGCDRIWFGAAAPLGLLARALDRRAVALTHGHEVGWAALPFARNALRRIADGCEVITYLTEFQRQRIAPIIGDRAALRRLTPGVNTDLYHPGVDGSAVSTTGSPVSFNCRGNSGVCRLKFLTHVPAQPVTHVPAPHTSAEPVRPIDLGEHGFRSRNPRHPSRSPAFSV